MKYWCFLKKIARVYKIFAKFFLLPLFKKKNSCFCFCELYIILLLLLIRKKEKLIMCHLNYGISPCLLLFSISLKIKCNFLKTKEEENKIQITKLFNVPFISIPFISNTTWIISIGHKYCQTVTVYWKKFTSLSFELQIHDTL